MEYRTGFQRGRQLGSKGMIDGKRQRKKEMRLKMEQRAARNLFQNNTKVKVLTYGFPKHPLQQLI
jgi:hypothetical protein